MPEKKRAEPVSHGWTGDLRARGPLVDVTVGIADSLERQLVRQGLEVPPPRTVTALIDTGASMSGISPGLAESLELQPHDKVSVIGIGGRVRMPRCRLRLSVNGLDVTIYALVLPLAGSEIQCLIGRDVLAHADFAYAGRYGQFQLRF